MPKLPPFDKYFYYKNSVQSPKEDIRFFKSVYKDFFKKKPRIFREDFCGSFYVSFHWVKDHPQNQAIVIDSDKDPLEYGKKNHLSQLNSSQKSRLKIVNKNVLRPHLPSAELITVSNFSYFTLKKRESLVQYFKNIKKALFRPGLFLIDAVGGPDCHGLSEEKVEHDDFNYYWEQSTFDPISHYAQFYIHFKRKGERKQKKAFSYQWRIWSLPELQDALRSAGFSKIHIYWEQTDKNGEGSGQFKKSKKGDICDTWIAYLACPVE